MNRVKLKTHFLNSKYFLVRAITFFASHQLLYMSTFKIKCRAKHKKSTPTQNLDPSQIWAKRLQALNKKGLVQQLSIKPLMQLHLPKR